VIVSPFNRKVHSELRLSHGSTSSITLSMPTSPLASRGGGPVGKVRKLFDEVSKLPRRQQDKIVEFLAPIIEDFKRRAS
jgi:hypothetical protein